MDLEELQKKLIERGVPDEDYSLTGGLPHDAYCVEKIGDSWCVYFSERGTKSRRRKFQSEHDACNYVYEKITEFL